MSDLLNQASLVMVPSGYKEDTVYSVVPSDGSGDLSFTRASNGTRINSAGLVEVCPWNFVQQSNAFSTSPWVNSGGTLTSGQTDPNGGSNAWKVEFAGGGTAYLGQYGMGQNGVITISAYFRADSTTTIGFNDGSTFANTITIGTTWQRYEFSYLVGGIQCNMQIDNYFGVSPSGQAKTFYIYGAQLNIGSTAKPYFPTTDRLNVPRLTYQNGGGGCPSLLLEKQSTNLVAYSEQFDDAAWTKQSSSITANATTSPDGTTNADKFIASNSNGFHAMYQLNSVLTGSYTMSVYAKKGEYDFLVLHDQFSGTFLTSYNLSTGAVYSGSGASIENVGNGWYRCIVTFNGGGNTVIASLSPSPSGSAGTNYQGDGTSGIYIWGAQVEASSYATSYISTQSSSATRVADTCYRNNYAAGITTEATLFADFEYQRNDGGYSTSCLVYNASIGDYIYLTVLANTIRAICTNSGTLQSNITSSTVTPNTRYKVAATFKTNDFKLYVNGVLVGTDTTGTMPTFSASSTNTYIGTDASYTEPVGKLNEFVAFPTALSDAECISLTTI